METNLASTLTLTDTVVQPISHPDPAQCADPRPSATQRVPVSAETRQMLDELARRAAEEWEIIAPLPLVTLRRHARRLMAEHGLDPAFEDFLTVILGNAVWRPVVAAIPTARRVLLLPHCLRDRTRCPATMDAFGLLCESCGGCATGRIQDAAEAMGYMVLVAEGTTVVTQLIKTGQLEAVIGVGCLTSLERSFPHLSAAAIPGLAIPLTQDGCENTVIDEDWLLSELNVMNESDDATGTHLNLDALRSEVQGWFDPDDLAQIMDLHGTFTEKLVLEAMEAGGKRWRPFLTASVCRALSAGADETGLRRLAVAVECFHKASLIHDDIEDHDDSRYDTPTLHAAHGVPLALNAGDLLVGEGYRLIAECGARPEILAALLKTASLGHRDLCIGQGEELKATLDGAILPVAQVLDLFRRKTAPAFSVALVLGAQYAGAGDDLCAMLEAYSTALGIAYQVRDDIEDFMDDGRESDLKALRPSMLLALAMAGDNDLAKQLLRKARQEEDIDPSVLRQAVRQMGLEERAWDLVDYYRNQALEALNPLSHAPLKRLLFQILYKILGHRPGERGSVHGASKPEDKAQA